MHAQEALVQPRSDDALRRAPRWARLLVLVYFFAGLTSIAYEVLWVRMLGLQFGASIFGVIIAVAAFMAGLGGGSLLGADDADPLPCDRCATRQPRGGRRSFRVARLTGGDRLFGLVFACAGHGLGVSRRLARL